MVTVLVCRRRAFSAARFASPLVPFMAVAALALCAEATTQPTADAPPAAPSPGPDDDPGSPFSISFSTDFTNRYFFRGIVQERDAFIVQPSIEIGYRVAEVAGVEVSLVGSLWASFHDSPTNPGTDSRSLGKWYEQDYSAGVALSRGAWNLTTLYTFYTSPADSFSSVQEIAFTLAYADEPFFGPMTFSPYVTLAIETNANGADGRDGRRGTYLELGADPGFDIGKTPLGDLRLSFPLSIGLSVSNYYEGDAEESPGFGFFNLGIQATFALPINDRYGSWSLTTGVDFLFLGEATRQYNDRSSEIIWTVGVGVSF